MAKIAIVVGHARRNTFCEALANAYKRGAESAGHGAQIFALSKMHFDPILHEGFTASQPLEPDLEAARDAIGAANHLVVVFPLWFGDVPAILKGFFERILQLGFALERVKGPSQYRPLLTGKSARIILTMGMPAVVFRWYFGAHALRMLRHHTLGFVGFRPVRATLYGMVDAATVGKRRRWLEEVEALGRQAL